MSSLPEAQQAAALIDVERGVRERADLLTRAEEVTETVIRPAAIRAVRAGADRTRTRQLARVSPRVFYKWLEADGIHIRPKRAKGEGGARPSDDGA